MAGIREKTKKLEKILKTLEERHGKVAFTNDKPLIDQLVLYLLAYDNSIAGARKAYRQLTDPKWFVDWNEVRVATLREVEDVLDEATVGRAAAPMLKGLLEQAYQAFCTVDLEPLREAKVDAIKTFAQNLRGGWPWTQTFLLTAVNDDGQVPFDPHTDRVALRLKLLDVHDTLTKKKKILKAYGQVVDPVRLHGLFVEHGKRLCTDESPRCDKCPLTKDCDYFAKQGRKAAKKTTGAPRGAPAKKASGRGAGKAKASPRAKARR